MVHVASERFLFTSTLVHLKVISLKYDYFEGKISQELVDKAGSEIKADCGKKYVEGPVDIALKHLLMHLLLFFFPL